MRTTLPTFFLYYFLLVVDPLAQWVLLYSIFLCPSFANASLLPGLLVAIIRTIVLSGTLLLIHKVNRNSQELSLHY
jgi:hypothetical protein